MILAFNAAASEHLTSPPTTVHRLRDIYIQLAEEIILNAIYQPGPHLTEGREWPPGDRFTMIGRKRLDNLEQLTRMVLEEGIAGDLIETGVWRGGATILMRAILQAYQVTDRRVFVADSFRAYRRSTRTNIPLTGPTKGWISWRY